MTGGSHGDGDIGFLHRDHSRAEISPPSDNSAAALPPLSPDGDGGSDMKLEDVGGLSLSRHESQGNESLNPGMYMSFSYHLP